MEKERTKGKIVTVEVFNDTVLANIMRTKLEAHGIECFLADEINPYATYAVQGVKLNVREEDLEKAQAIVREATSPDDTDTDEGTPCPYCGSTNTTVTLGGHSGMAIWWLFLSSLPFYGKQHFYCQSCKKYFKKNRKE